MQAVQSWAARGAECMLGKPKLAFAKRGSKVAVTQTLKHFIFPLLQHKGVWCSQDSSPSLLMQSHLGLVQD